MLFTRDLSADALSNPSAGCGGGCGGVCGASAATTGAFSCGCGLGLEEVVVGGIGPAPPPDTANEKDRVRDDDSHGVCSCPVSCRTLMRTCLNISSTDKPGVCMYRS